MSGRYEPKNPEEFETVTVMKQVYGYTRYRFRIANEDVSHDYLKSLGKFKIKYSSNITPEDVFNIEKRWGHLFIRETV